MAYLLLLIGCLKVVDETGNSTLTEEPGKELAKLMMPQVSRVDRKDDQVLSGMKLEFDFEME